MHVLVLAQLVDVTGGCKTACIPVKNKEDEEDEEDNDKKEEDEEEEEDDEDEEDDDDKQDEEDNDKKVRPSWMTQAYSIGIDIRSLYTVTRGWCTFVAYASELHLC
eukprot:TRINITY_DN2317_c0_g2_i1.p1 TRINITY_DN2317_c0_g2~~TRINITY_DN2317_c0_g2_i1.p1  ORF type:complete len:106 (+),score=33.09 TRINITY_DN2317_c0_g2_i1:407-724(+)